MRNINSIVFINPNQENVNVNGLAFSKLFEDKKRYKRLPPLGLLYIMTAASALYPGQCNFIDNYYERLSDENLISWCTEKIGTKNIGLVCFGGTCLQSTQAIAIAKKLKETNQNIITVYGGPNATGRPEKFVNHFDYVFRGSGVENFVSFLNGERIDQIPGLCYKGNIVPPCYSVDFKTYKFPGIQKLIPLQGFNKKYYSTNNILTAIGCPYSCRFCSAKSIWDKHVLYRDFDDVMDEIYYIVNSLHIKNIVFREDNFSTNRNRMIDFCEQFRRLKISWSCQARISAIDDELVKIMKASGCKQVSCGWESINDSTLTYIKKGHTAQQIVDTISIFEKNRLRYTGGFIVGLPNENKEEILSTTNFVKSTKHNRYSNIPRVVRFLGIPASELYWEILRDDLVEYNWNGGELLFPRTRYLSGKEIEALI